jgi:hypothetical protein
MRLYIAWLLVKIALTADPCFQLCSQDGPDICTKGSWTKPNGYCQGYLYKGEPLNKHYCYHTRETVDVCPPEGRGVKAADVAGLLAPVLPAPSIEIYPIGFLHFELKGRSKFLVAVPEPIEYKNIASEWLSLEPNGIIYSSLLLEKALRFPILVEDCTSESTITDGAIEGICKDPSTGNVIAFFQFKRTNEELPPNWGDRICSMLLKLKEQLDLRINLKDWY